MDEKELFKEALQEWLDNKLAEFGKWSLITLGAAGLYGLIYFLLWTYGWHNG